MEQHDFFSSLPNANDNDSDLETLSKDEIISMLLILHFLIMLTVPGNIYIFLSILPFHPAGRVWEHFFLPIDLCQKKFSRVRGGQGIT